MKLVKQNYRFLMSEIPGCCSAAADEAARYYAGWDVEIAGAQPAPYPFPNNAWVLLLFGMSPGALGYERLFYPQPRPGILF